MNLPTAASDRLFNFRHAIDDPRVVFLLIVIGGLFAAAAVVIGGLAGTGVIKGDLRKEIVQRTLAWGVIAPILIVPILLGAAWVMLLVTIMALLCYREFARATGLFREKLMSALVVLGILAVNFAAFDHWYGLFVALPPLTIAVMTAGAILSDRPKGYVQRVGLSALAFLLFGVCLAHLSYFANDPAYRPLLLLILLCVGLNDIFGFCVGKTIGGPKLCPNTSPGKTLSGAMGAMVLTTLTFVLLGGRALAGQPIGEMRFLIVLGLLLSLAGILGDLMISSVKRDVGVKDMGALIPGHGGVLDRCNSLLLAAPALFHAIGYIQGVGLDQPMRIITGP